jgi:glutaminyl-tRNA synthetase
MVTGVEGEKAPALQLETLLALGLDQRTAENALVNSKVTANLAAVIAEVKSFAMVMPFLI